MSDEKVRVLLIAGTGQNGATLLSRVLGSLPGFCSIGEIGHLWDKALIDERPCGAVDRFAIVRSGRKWVTRRSAVGTT